MFSRPLTDNPHAYASLMRLPQPEHPPQASNRFAPPKPSGAATAGASAAPEQGPGNHAFAQPSGAPPAALPPNPPPPPGSHIDVYA